MSVRLYLSVTSIRNQSQLYLSVTSIRNQSQLYLSVTSIRNQSQLAAKWCVLEEFRKVRTIMINTAFLVRYFRAELIGGGYLPRTSRNLWWQMPMRVFGGKHLTISLKDTYCKANGIYNNAFYVFCLPKKWQAI